MSGTEQVLKLGGEGVGSTIFRTFAGGGFQFHVESSGMSLDDDDEEVWTDRTSERVGTLQKALDEVSKRGEWVLFYPMFIHPEYRDEVRQRVKESVDGLAEDVAGMFRHQRGRWERMCSGEDDRW